MRHRFLLAASLIFLALTTAVFAARRPPAARRSVAPTPAPASAEAPAAPTSDGPAFSAEKLAQAEKIVNDPLLRGARASFLVQHLASGKRVFERDPDVACSPASTNKLITGAAAFAVLGPTYRFKTRVFADSRPDGRGVIHGNLYLVGGGDPLLVQEQAWALAHNLHLLGVRRVAGSLVGDDSFHDSTRYYREWGPQNFHAYKAPLGALSMNFNTVFFWVRPGPKIGAPATVELDPQPDGLSVGGSVQTVAGRVNHTTLAYNDQSATIGGFVGLDTAPDPARQAIGDPLTFSLGVFRNLLRKEGIEVDGASVGGKTPSQAPFLCEHESPELSQILRELYRFSNNFTAEQILRTLGAVKFGPPGSRENGAAAVVDWLKQENLWRDGVVVVDGSGLARENKQTAASMVGVLVWMAKNPRLFPEYLDAQAIAGVDGTLRHRFRKSPLLGRVRAKTGFINNVVGLGGYCYDARGEMYAFSALINDYKGNAGARGPQHLTEELLEVLMK
jgi:D-alanyl-D-alanine carboxypeptidase/D-alanyl-D-alanine-endopeptidase (penicillin-binding protein 4)